MTQPEDAGANRAEPAHLASLGSITRAVSLDVVGWIAPWVALLVATILIRPLTDSEIWLVALSLAALLISLAAIAIDIRAVKRFGFTNGFARMNLRLIDPVDDEIIWKARLQPKSIRKLLMGKYEVLDIS